MSIYKWNADRLQGHDIHDAAPSNGQVLRWNDTESRWEPTSGEADAASIQGHDVQDVAPSDNDVLEWNESESRWEPSSTLSDHIGGGLTEHGIDNLSDLNTDLGSNIDESGDSRPPEGSAGGDLGGTYPNPDVIALQGHNVQDVAPSDGNILIWNDTESRWEPVSQDSPTQSEFDDHSARHESGGADEINVGGLSGVLADRQDADHLQGRDVQDTAPSDNDVLAWNDVESRWEPDGSFQAHIDGGLPEHGIDTLSDLNSDLGSDIDESGDARPPTGSAGGDLGGTYPDPEVRGIWGTAIRDPSLNQGLRNGYGLLYISDADEWFAIGPLMLAPGSASLYLSSPPSTITIASTQTFVTVDAPTSLKTSVGLDSPNNGELQVSAGDPQDDPFVPVGDGIYLVNCTMTVAGNGNDFELRARFSTEIDGVITVVDESEIKQSIFGNATGDIYLTVVVSAHVFLGERAADPDKIWLEVANWTGTEDIVIDNMTITAHKTSNLQELLTQL